MIESTAHGGPYPHGGGCIRCSVEKRCNVCGRPRRHGRNPGGACTNGRCSECHAACCTPGGNTTPGHGFGAREVAEKQAARVNTRGGEFCRHCGAQAECRESIIHRDGCTNPERQGDAK